MLILRIVLALGCMLFGSHLFIQSGIADDSVAITPDCDMPAAAIGSQSCSSETACFDLCQQNAKCRGFVFVSGWNRCFFKSDVRRRSGIVMHGGGFERKGGTDVVKSFGPHTDHSGRDLRQVSGVATEQICQTNCSTESACVGYVWIEGYSDCWLKKTVGKSVSKQFFCGLNPKVP